MSGLRTWLTAAVAILAIPASHADAFKPSKAEQVKIGKEAAKDVRQKMGI